MENYTQVKRKEEKQFIENMVFLMEDRKITQTRMVELIGMELKLSTFKAWQSKRNFPPLYYCRKIAKILGYTIEEMTTIELYKRVG
jgi:predicted HTH domain antitoxin